ncbi:hypothetical protein FRB95_012722 [Tulasnella sp. JGI-2019a]|nr:hypothetical protein FRB95_012722 [Tulasnella sp. JGI-2019a]
MKRASNYANFVSIIQSSGFGKSRMVDEQAKLVFTIPIKLLVIKESQAYPLPDVEISQYLCSQFGEDPIKSTEFYGSFLSSLFRVVEAEVVRLGGVFPTRSALAFAWRMHLEGPRRREALYHRAIEEHKQQLTNTPTPDHATALKSLLRTVRNKVKPPTKGKKRGKCEEANTIIMENDVEIIVYFDEAHVLHSENSDGSPDDATLNALCSSFTAFVQRPIFFIFISSRPSLFRSTPSSGLMVHSAQARYAEDLQTPISETPFDYSPLFPVTLWELSLQTVSTVEFMAQSGRPM